MKKALKYFAAILAAAILCLTLAACGESAGAKYVYKETKYESDGLFGSSELIEMFEEMYDIAYAGSTIEVKDGEIVWTFGEDMGEKSIMTYTMDGDKYMFDASSSERFSQMLSAIGAGSGDMTFYGQKTEEGFAFVMRETVTGAPGTTYLTCTSYFTAA